MHYSLNLFLLLICLVGASECVRPLRTSKEGRRKPVTSSYSYSTYWFNQTVDHYGFTTGATFRQKYLVNDSWWDPSGGAPIFFYAGNEGVIEAFAENTGFMWDIAPEFQAMLVFAEHRYYGESLPFGNESLTKDPLKVGYLSSSQALADYANLITWLRGSIPGASESPVIVFGGSYGGMLAAWMRAKFPHIVQGAIAGSAPVAQFVSPCDAFGRIVTSDFSSAAQNNSCSNNIRSSWAALSRVAAEANRTGLAWLNSAFKLCPSSQLRNESDVQGLKAYLSDIWTNLAMMDYPYETEFLAPLPPNPVTVACSPLGRPVSGDRPLLQAIFKAASVYFNYTGKASCLNLEDEDDIGASMWTYQACTEMVMPFCYDGQNDMFQEEEWDLAKYTASCLSTWGVSPQPSLANTLYGGRDFSAASNIIFSNGLLDPWSSGGVLKSGPDGSGIVAVIIPEGAHHLDLRASNPKDPVSVIQARKVERQWIKKWVRSHKHKAKRSSA